MRRTNNKEHCRINKEFWGTHEFNYEIYVNSDRSPYDFKFQCKCLTCGITWGKLSDDYWKVTNNGFVFKNKSGQTKKIITCNEYIIKNILE